MGLITLHKKSSHPDPSGDNKQSVCKLSPNFCFCRDKIGTKHFCSSVFPTKTTTWNSAV